MLEPLRCYGGLGADGYPMPPGTDLDFPCQCYLPHDPMCPPGIAQHIVGRDPNTWRDFVVRARLRPRSEDSTISDYQPLFSLAKRLRMQGRHLAVHADEFTYIGTIDADRSTVQLWLYAYEPAGSRGFDDLALDADGHAWVPKADRRRRSGFRWLQVDARIGLIRAGVR